VCASFQAAVVETLVDKTAKAAKEQGVSKVIVAGGVAANSSLRQEMERSCKEAGVTLYLPGMGLCIDNAAMIALAGYLHYQQGERSELDLNPAASAAL
jgi:N6-L-threonylcarbamoyladenine synthase